MLSDSTFIPDSPDSSGYLTNWSVTHCFGVIYCNWRFYLASGPSKAIACVCRKTCSPVGCIDSGCWLILLYWHVLMLSHCLTNRLVCRAESTPCFRRGERFYTFFAARRRVGNKQVFRQFGWARLCVCARVFYPLLNDPALRHTSHCSADYLPLPLNLSEDCSCY